MLKLSVIIGYKNREIERVRQAIDSVAKQSDGSLELIFVDYGSDKNLSQKVKEICENHSFVRYILNETEGMYWNRSHALNSGAQFANAEYILFTDVDLIYGEGYFAHLCEVAQQKAIHYTQMVLLQKNEPIPERFNHKNQLLSTSGKGIFMLAKSKFQELNGLDEFYRIWGMEDNDFYLRALALGLEENWISYDQYPAYHIWHPIYSQEFKNTIPEKWMDNMAIYYMKNWGKVKRNQHVIGHVYLIEERKSLLVKEGRAAAAIEVQIPNKGLFPTKTLWYRNTFTDLKNLRAGQVIKIKVPRAEPKLISIAKKSWMKGVEAFAKLAGRDKKLAEYRLLDRDTYFIPELDMRYFIWNLIVESELVEEYYIQEKAEETIYFLSRK